ncbi:acyl-CoA N-acyltransferase [Xylariaceae sp. FL0255]|nr:acyl-CoA N-acyltransferase [Xylariaceae sp. FL0255]
MKHAARSTPYARSPNSKRAKTNDVNRSTENHIVSTALDPIQEVNRKSDADFVKEHMRPSPSVDWSSWIHPKTSKLYTVELRGTANLNSEDLEACYKLIEETSRHDYEASTTGWDREKKIKEMKSPDLRYIIVRDLDTRDEDENSEREGSSYSEEGDRDGEERQRAAMLIRGFTSLMPTYEEGEPVLYCYEIHLKPELQRTGLSKLLMSYLESVAINTPPITKVMLTCFLSNEKAFEFYKRSGFEVDPLTPRPKKLRNGKTVVVDYAIMSKVVIAAREVLTKNLVENG